MNKSSSYANHDNVKTMINSLLLTCKNGLDINNFQKLYEENIQEKIPYKELGFCYIEDFILSMPDTVDVRYTRSGIMLLKAKCDSSNVHLKKLIDQQQNSNRPKRAAFLSTLSPQDTALIGTGRAPYLQNRHKGNTNYSQNQRSSISQNYRNQNQRSSISQNYRNSQCFRPPRRQIPEWTQGHSKKNRPFPDDIKDRLLILISKYPSGLESDDLLKAYYHDYKNSIYQNDLSYKDYGFKNCEELFLSLEDIFITQKVNSKFLFLPIITSVQKKSEELENYKVMCENFVSVSINDIIEYIDGFPYLQVSIGEVYSPHNFSMIVNGSLLDKLMGEIQEFYVEDILNDWKLSTEHIVLNHPVIIFNAGAYTRAIITAFKELDKIEVLCVDYGTTDVVSESELLYLHKKFFNLPSQAVPAELFGIKPTTGIHWDNCRSICERFLQLVAGKESLFAQIMDSEPHNMKRSVRLIDTEDEVVDVCINDLLVSEGYAHFAMIIPNGETTNVQNSALANQIFDEIEEFDGSPKASKTYIKNCPNVQNGSTEIQDCPLKNNFQNCFENSLNQLASEGEINERKSCVDNWLKHLPNSIASTSESHHDRFTMDAIMFIDLACQSILQKRSLLLSQLKEDVNNDVGLQDVKNLNVCVRNLKSVKETLDGVET